MTTQLRRKVATFSPTWCSRVDTVASFRRGDRLRASLLPSNWNPFSQRGLGPIPSDELHRKAQKATSTKTTQPVLTFRALVTRIPGVTLFTITWWATRPLERGRFFTSSSYELKCWNTKILILQLPFRYANFLSAVSIN